jgi:hypothetical protein
VIKLSLKDTLMQEMKTAMREKDVLKKSTIVMLRAAIKQVEVDKRIEMDDEGIIEIIAKQVKQKRAAIEEFAKGNRSDLVDEAKNEIEILNVYLPVQMTEEEVNVIVKETIDEVGASTMKDMGKVMKALTQKTKGRADGKMVSDAVKALLS